MHAVDHGFGAGCGRRGEKATTTCREAKLTEERRVFTCPPLFGYPTSSLYNRHPRPIPHRGVPLLCLTQRIHARAALLPQGVSVRFTVVILSACLTLMAANTSLSHSGGTNAAGCHTNHKTGGYHCHNRKTLAPGTVHYCHVVGGETRCGYASSTCKSLVRKYGGYCSLGN